MTRLGPKRWKFRAKSLPPRFAAYPDDRAALEAVVLDALLTFAPSIFHSTVDRVRPKHFRELLREELLEIDSHNWGMD